MAYLTPNQLRLLRELEFYGGVLIVRAHRDQADYDHLEKVGLVTGFSVSMSDMRYKITKLGRRLLEER